MFTPVLAKHSKSSSLVVCIAVRPVNVQKGERNRIDKSLESVSGSSACRTGVFSHYGLRYGFATLPGISNDLEVVRLL